jgi:hypothetical protein
LVGVEIVAQKQLSAEHAPKRLIADLRVGVVTTEAKDQAVQSDPSRHPGITPQPM